MKRHLRFPAIVGLLLLTAGPALAVNFSLPKYTPGFDAQLDSADEAGMALTAVILHEPQSSFPATQGLHLWNPGPGYTFMLTSAVQSVAEDDLSARYYMSWDDDYLYFTSVVKDTIPDYRASERTAAANLVGPANGSDVAQFTFNPNNDPAHTFVDNQSPFGDPGDQLAAIFDVSPGSNDDGDKPYVYRHGPLFSAAQSDVARDDMVASSENGNAANSHLTTGGYTLETRLPWSVLMDDEDPNYVPAPGDMHGIGFLLVGKDGADAGALMASFGSGPGDIGNPAKWDKITLAPEPGTALLSLLAVSALLMGRQRMDN